MFCVSGQKRRVWTGQHRVAAEELRLHMSHPGHRLRPLAQGKVWKRKGRLSGNGKTGKQKFDIKKRNRIQPKSSCETWQALAWDLECCYTVIRTCIRLMLIFLPLSFLIPLFTSLFISPPFFLHVSDVRWFVLRNLPKLSGADSNMPTGCTPHDGARPSAAIGEIGEGCKCQTSNEKLTNSLMMRIGQAMEMGEKAWWILVICDTCDTCVTCGTLRFVRLVWHVWHVLRFLD